MRTGLARVLRTGAETQRSMECPRCTSEMRYTPHYNTSICLYCGARVSVPKPVLKRVVAGMATGLFALVFGWQGSYGFQQSPPIKMEAGAGSATAEQIAGEVDDGLESEV